MSKNVARVTHPLPLVGMVRLLLFFLPLTLLTTSCVHMGKAAPITIKVNQLGYLPNAGKVAIVPEMAVKSFVVINAENGEVAYESTIEPAKLWPFSNERVHQLNFSELTTNGRYQLKVGELTSIPFEINNTVLNELHEAVIRGFYLNRASIELTPELAGKFARPAGHADTAVKVHASAATQSRRAGHVLSAPKGWYDAGDYGKYTVNSGISTYTLLLAYKQFPNRYNALDVGIPESSNSLPDLLDEIKWNLDWLETMQDEDGGVYHKLTALNFSSMSMRPQDHVAQRYMIGKSVTAALDFSAVMAVASRVYAEFDSSTAKRYRDRAINAYQWALEHPDRVYVQPEDVATGAYDDKDVSDEFAWAAAELFLLTGDTRYWQEFQRFSNVQDNGVNHSASWDHVGALPYISILDTKPAALAASEIAKLQRDYLSAADKQLAIHRESAYHVAMSKDDFRWGSNSLALNNGLILFQAYRLSGEVKYKKASMSALNYVLGTNPTGYSFVTGFGHKTPMFLHYRPSTSDDILEAAPGMIAGGPHTGRQDSCDYEGDLPATNYADTVCSYSTNETAINWNAPLVYLLGAAISSQ